MRPTHIITEDGATLCGAESSEPPTPYATKPVCHNCFNAIWLQMHDMNRALDRWDPLARACKDAVATGERMELQSDSGVLTITFDRTEAD